MTRRITSWIRITAFAILSACGPIAFAVEGFLIEEQVDSVVFGKPSRHHIHTYISPAGIRIEEKDTISLLSIRSTAEPAYAFYQITPSNKTYMQHGNFTLPLIIYVTALADCNAQRCRIKPGLYTVTNETANVSGHRAQKLIVTAGGALLSGAKSENWHSKDWPLLDEALRLRWNLTIDALQSGAAGSMDYASLRRVIDDIHRNYGVQVSAISTLSADTRTTISVVRVEKRNLNDALFSVPSGYTRQRSPWADIPGLPQ